jgi:hypothetical protein
MVFPPSPGYSRLYPIQRTLDYILENKFLSKKHNNSPKARMNSICRPNKIYLDFDRMGVKRKLPKDFYPA